MCLLRHHMALMERHFARNFEDRAFSESLTAGYKQRATSLSAVQGFCFCSLPYTFRYMFVNACAFLETRARATARAIRARSLATCLLDMRIQHTAFGHAYTDSQTRGFYCERSWWTNGCSFSTFYYPSLQKKLVDKRLLHIISTFSW